MSINSSNTDNDHNLYLIILSTSAYKVIGLGRGSKSLRKQSRVYFGGKIS